MIFSPYPAGYLDNKVESESEWDLRFDLLTLSCNYRDNKVEGESEVDQDVIFSPYLVIILKTKLKVKVNGNQDLIFSPYPADFLGHIFALLALNWIAHLLHHILTPNISYL